jgi:C1A family cysteine protease
MKFALLFCAVFILTHATYDNEFAAWVAGQNKSYGSDEEYQYRLEVFSANVDKIQQLNEESNGGAVFAINKFADLTAEEFDSKYKGYNGLTAMGVKRDMELPQVEAPATFDWEPTGKVTPVKNQEQCGSCWAFSATENIESVYMIAKGLTNANFKPLAPQQIVDCDKKDAGCNGGWPYLAYEYIISAGGQDTEASYPYKAVNQACHFLPADVEAKISSWKYVGRNNEADMLTGVATVSPLSICVDAQPWQFYSGGVMKASQCGTSLDHCVQITAYDTAAATKYWNVRNSWGADWGEKGFIRLEYGTNTCGLAMDPSTAVV